MKTFRFSVERVHANDSGNPRPLIHHRCTSVVSFWRILDRYPVTKGWGFRVHASESLKGLGETSLRDFARIIVDQRDGEFVAIETTEGA